MRRRSLLFLVLAASACAQESFRFVILGDRTGEEQPGIYERVWREAAAERPAFFLSVGDNIQGLQDRIAEAQWRSWRAVVAPYRSIPLYLTPGNHDVWSEASEKMFRRYSRHDLHYSFDYGPAHVTVLDNSRSDELPAHEMEFLEADLRANANRPLKFVVSHRPGWLVGIALRDTALPIHQLAKRYGVKYVIAGHIHQMLRLELEGVTYISMPSSGGHLRLSKKYEDGWFFGFAKVEVRGTQADFHIQELGGRTTALPDWGTTGLLTPRVSHR